MSRHLSHAARGARRRAWVAAVATLLAVVLLPGPTAGRAAPAAPSPDTWPVPDLVTDLHDLLTYYYDQRATAGTPHFLAAPEVEQDKRDAAKDADTLWEFQTGPKTKCHAAATDAQFINCTGQRLAATFGRTYGPTGQPALFSAPRGFYGNFYPALTAGYYGLYHAFAHDFDATCLHPCALGPGQTQRDSQTYHKRMLRAYEAHHRDLLVRMFRDTRADGQFQFDLTRSAGLLESGYVRLVQAVEEAGAWAPGGQDRKDALALVNGLNQRIWWEWVVPRPNGPVTAGFGDIGSRKTYDAAVAADPAQAGKHRFYYAGQWIESLRPASQDTLGGPWDGLWYDADFTVPGEFYCGFRFPLGSRDYDDCMISARAQNIGGTKSPYGQYYGPAGCPSRGGADSCGQVNLGSEAEEWLWTFVGARAGMFLMRELAQPDPEHHPGGPDPDLPAGAVGPAEYAAVSDRLGFGVSGWHGADPHFDDMEWPYHQPPGTNQAIRTLSAGRHDDEPQGGAYSLGENEPGASTARRGDTWVTALQRGDEYPGGMENHMPGPNPLYAALLFGLVLSDRPDEATAGLSPSLYDQYLRNNPEEFLPWVWLALSSLNRCKGVTDPTDPACFALAPGPGVPVVKRVPLDFPATAGSPSLHFDYLWRMKDGASLTTLSTSMAEPDKTCRGASGGLPWRQVWDAHTETPADYILDEGGFGAFNEQVQILGGLLRVVAARYPLDSADPNLQADYVKQRAEVLGPWYAEAYGRVKRILQLYRDPTNGIGYGYLPEVENSACASKDLGDPTPTMLTWQQGTGDTVRATTIRRAMHYGNLAVWYWWYASDWLDVEAKVW